MAETTLINKDLILRERLALQRTILANQSTFLSFLRTTMYFVMAGLTIRNLFSSGDHRVIELVFYSIAGLVFIAGISNYITQRKMIQKSEIHIGHFKEEYISK